MLWRRESLVWLFGDTVETSETFDKACSALPHLIFELPSSGCRYMEYEVLERINDGRQKPTDLSFELLKDITENFSDDREIGHGGFAIVYRGVLPNGKTIAVKKIRNNHLINEKLFFREVDTLLNVEHENIVRFLGFCASTHQIAMKTDGKKEHIYAEVRERLLCFEHISNGSLTKYITDELRGLEWNIRFEIIKGICEGLYHLHNEKKIYHMDLKPDNILLDNDMMPKITDFGLSRLDEKSRTMSVERVGSLGYCAPEYLHQGIISFKSDMYSLGVIIMELVTGQKALPDMNNNVLRRWRHRWKKTGKETPLAYQQVAKCLEFGLLCKEMDPSKRPYIWEMIHDIRKIDGRNGKISNAYEHTFGQISPYSEDDMLVIEPLQLHFLFELNKQMSCALQLTNETYSYIAFSVENTSPMAYCIQPQKGIIQPRSTCTVEITMQPQCNALRYMHRVNEFTVRSTKVNACLAVEDITRNMSLSEAVNVVDEVNLSVVFDANDQTEELEPRKKKKKTEELDNISEGVHAVTVNSSSGFNSLSDPDNLSSASSGRGALTVVIVYAFDYIPSTQPTWTVDRGVFWLVQEKLTSFGDSCLGYVYPQTTPNTYTSDMKLVDRDELKKNGYKALAERTLKCTKNMAAGLAWAHKMISYLGYDNGIILFLSDGLVNNGDFFDGAENFISKVPVHTFTLGGDAYNNVLKAISANSPGGKFSATPIPERPSLSASFSKLLDSLLCGIPMQEEKPPSPISGRGPLDVVIVYAFDYSHSIMARKTMDSVVFWLVQDKLTHFADSCMGYIYFVSNSNKYTSDMKLVNPSETKNTGYTTFNRCMLDCPKNMASGLLQAHKMICNRGYHNGIILFFSDGLVNNGDFFDGAENFISEVPVHTFTLGGDAYNNVLKAIAENSPGGKFYATPIPEWQSRSASFSKVLDSLLCGIPMEEEKPPSSISGRGALTVVIVYAFDYIPSTQPTWTVDRGVFWLVQEKLTSFGDSFLGYVYPQTTPNTYTSDMKLVDLAELKKNGYKALAERTLKCTKNMAAGLAEAHKMISYLGYDNGIILFLSDGLVNNGDFFDGAENFISKVPVHTFTLGGDAYNNVLKAIAANSPGGKFYATPIPERPSLSASFSKVLDSLLCGIPMEEEKPPSPISGRGPLDVVIVYGFDCSHSIIARDTMNNGVFWLVQDKLTHFADSCMGYIYFMSNSNKYTSDMKLVDPSETKNTGYTTFNRCMLDCPKNMASGLLQAHKMISNRGYHNGIILFFSDGLVNNGDFFDGAENFISKVPVHTFTLGGNAYNYGLQAIAANSPGGMFHPLQVPRRPHRSSRFSNLLDIILTGTIQN